MWVVRARTRAVAMEIDICEILWDFTVQTDHEIYGRRPDVILVQKDKNFCQITNRFCLPLWWKSGYQRIRKDRLSPRFGSRVEKDMEHESQGYTTSDRCPRNNTHKVKKLVKGNIYWNSDKRVAENCPPTHSPNPPKGSWCLRKLLLLDLKNINSLLKQCVI